MVGLLIIGMIAGVLGATTAVFLGGGFLTALASYSLAGCAGMLVAGLGKALYDAQEEARLPYSAQVSDEPQAKRQTDSMEQWLEDDEAAPPQRAAQDDDRAA